MGEQVMTQARLVAGAGRRAGQTTELMSFFDEDGEEVSVLPQSGADLPFAPVTTATAIGTAAKTTTSPEPAVNTIVPIKFTNGNSAASPTVAFNGGTARAVLLGGTAPGAGEVTLAANGVGFFWFDGTNLHQMGVYS